MHRILICDDEDGILRYLSKLLKAHGYAVETCSSGAALQARLGRLPDEPFDLLLQDVRLPDYSGIDLLKLARRKVPELPVVMMTAHGSVDDAVHAMRLGAYDYVLKPFPKEKILGVLAKALENRRLADENRRLREELQRGGGDTSIIFCSARFRQVYDLTLQVASSDANILILGESGTGKELTARAIHQLSKRRNQPLVMVNCPAIPEHLLESELFGHVKGSFTGAIRDKAGRFEMADGGTIFLDEIGDISPAMQVRLLRVLQERKVERVGGTRPVDVDVRVVAATNQNLPEKIKRGEFREDLFYRLKVVTLALPPLRERLSDIPLLVDFFVQRFNGRFKRDIRGVSDEVMRFFMSYEWPGNVRELEHVMEHAFILCPGTLILSEHLPPDLSTHIPGAGSRQLREDENEAETIRQALEKCGWNKAKAARLLGISRRTIYRKIEELAIQE